MHQDPDDPQTLHTHSVYGLPDWCRHTRIGRAYARRKITADIARECVEHGYTRTGPLCFHYGEHEGRSAVFVHFTVRDQLTETLALGGTE